MNVNWFENRIIDSLRNYHGYSKREAKSEIYDIRETIFGVDPVAWKIAALALVNKMRTALKQTTVAVEFTDQDGIDFYYLNSKEAFKDSVKQILQKEVEKGRSPQDIEKYTDIFEKE